MKVMSTNLSSPAQLIYKLALLVVVKETMYSDVPLVNLHWTLNAQHYHFLQCTKNMSIHSLSAILLKMTPVNIIVIYVKENETKIIGSITVKNVAILFISNVFLEDPQISSNTYNNNLFRVAYIFDYHPHSILSLRKLKTTLNVTVVVILVKSLSVNVPNVISI